MHRLEPNELFEDKVAADQFLSTQPCSVVALNCALKDFVLIEEPKKFDDELKCWTFGYLKLNDFHKVIKKYFPKVKKHIFEKQNRETLFDADYHYDAFVLAKAIACVKGHYIYVNNDTYYSYFNNDNDELVAVWFLNFK